jgi:hypothetical protein
LRTKEFPVKEGVSQLPNYPWEKQSPEIHKDKNFEAFHKKKFTRSKARKDLFSKARRNRKRKKKSTLDIQRVGGKRL